MTFLTIANLAVLSMMSSGPQRPDMDKVTAALPAHATAVVVLKGGSDDPPGDDRGRGARGGNDDPPGDDHGRGRGGNDDPPGDDHGGRRIGHS